MKKDTPSLFAEAVTLHAMSLEVPDTPGHPNKHPFKGILTRLDKPSDNAPMGSGKRLVVMTKAAAEKALPTLLGMGVDLQDDLSGHNVKKKVGIITEAHIEGDALLIEGFLYAADFPDEVERIQAEKDDLGFSWEVKEIYTMNAKANPLVITDCIFTGAAILYKDEAAYTTTQLAAQAEENTMDEKILEQLKALADTVGAITTRIETMEAAQAEADKTMQAGKEHMAKVEKHAAALERVAEEMEKDGIGGHASRGHVKACHAMADHIRASAAVGKIASEWSGFDGFHAEADKQDDGKDKEIKDLKDTVASLNTKITDLQASATRTTKEPERKTLSPHISALLAKGGIAIPADGAARMSVSEVDKALSATTLSSVQRMEIKNGLEKSGILAA